MLLTAGLFAGFSHCIWDVRTVGDYLHRTRWQAANCNARAHHDTLTPLVTYQVGRLTTYVGDWCADGAGRLTGAGQCGGQWLAGQPFDSDWPADAVDWVELVGRSALAALVGIGRVARHIGQWMRRSLQSHHPAAPLGLGLANGLLPCGAVYAMALVAATSGNPIQGAMIMFAFEVGHLASHAWCQFFGVATQF